MSLKDQLPPYLSFEDQRLQLLIHFSWTHPAVTIDLQKQLNCVSVDLSTIHSQVFYPDYFFKEDVEFAIAISCEVEILYYFY